METLKARGQDNPANDQGVTKLMFQATDVQVFCPEWPWRYSKLL